jgi:hypothetical protein
LISINSSKSIEAKEAILKNRIRKKTGRKIRSIRIVFFQLMEYRRMWKTTKEKDRKYPKSIME